MGSRLVKKQDVSKRKSIIKPRGRQQLHNVAKAFNTMMGGIGQFFAGTLSNIPMGTYPTINHTPQQIKNEEQRQIGKAMTYLSPSAYVTDLVTEGGLNPERGAETLSKKGEITKAAATVGDIVTLAKAPKLVKKATSKVRKEIGARQVAREINEGIDNAVLSTEPEQSIYQYTIPSTISPSTSATTYRTSALRYRDWIRGADGKPPIVSVNDPNAAFIELRSHPDGHATVKRKHLIDKKTGEDITFTFDKNEANRNNVIQLEFDDSHGQPVRTLTPEEVEYQINSGQQGNWKGTIIDEEFEKGNRRGLTFRNITPKQADQLIDFIDNNRGKDVYVHCLRGSSRSGAVDKFLQEYYGYSRPPGKLIKEASPEVYDTLVDAYKRKHGSGLNYYK